MDYKKFNKNAKTAKFIGNAMNKSGVISKKYKNWYSVSYEENPPLPNNLLYNSITNRFVKSNVWKTNNGNLREAKKSLGYVLSGKNIMTGSTLITKHFPIGFYGNMDYISDNTAVGRWVDLLDSLNVKNKEVEITLHINEYDNTETGGQILEAEEKTSIFAIGNKYIEDLRKFIIFYINGGQTNFYHETNQRGGYAQIKMYKKIKGVKQNQQFLDGLNFHCVLSPIIRYYEEKEESVSTKSAKAVYTGYLNKLRGKTLKTGEVKNSLLANYKNGCFLDDLKKIVSILPIDIIIYSPLVLYETKQKPIFEIKTTKKIYADKRFEYINTRTNHLEILISKQNETTELNSKEMSEKLVELKKDNKLWTKSKTAITNIFTEKGNYKLIDNSKDIIDDFENINNLKCNKIFSNTNAHKFVLSGVHYNGAVDFNNDYNDDDDDNHIDMEKAYKNFNKCPLYDKDNAFLCRCSYYANKNIDNEFAINNVGYWRIDNLNFDNVSENIYKIINRMGDQLEHHSELYRNHGIYPHIDLKLLDSVGVKFDVIEGFYGLPMNIDFGEDMLRKFKDGEETDEGIGLYSSWTGRCGSVSNRGRVYMNGDKDFLQTLKHDIETIGKKEQLWVNDESKEATITYDKDICNSKIHITGYITGYQRVSTLLQLFKFEYDNIIKVVVDGIFYNGEKPDLISSFREEEKELKLNGVCDMYMSEYENVEYNDKVIVDFEKPIRNTIYTGAGGTGKTHLNMNKKNFQRVGYLAHSNKLCRATKNEFIDKNCFVAPYQWVIQDNPELNKMVKESCDVILIDEASTLTFRDIQKIQYRLRGIPLIFMGDITHQTLPIDPPKPYKNDDGDICYTTPEKYNVDKILSLFNNKIHLTKNYRFQKCKKQTANAEQVREFMDSNIPLDNILNYCKNVYGKLSEEEMLKQLKYDDILLSSRHINKDDLNEKISKILKPKWYINKTNKGYFKGDVVDIEPVGLSPKQYELRYCFTIHSVQGETLKDNQNLYIDTRQISDSRILYTALSRAKYAHQIKFF